MPRKTLVILMIEEEQPEGLSARKLVAESAKHNVLTSYTAEHGLEMLRRFPQVDAVLLHAGLLKKRGTLAEEVHAVAPGVPVILANPFGNPPTQGVDYIVDSHRPQELLQLLESKIPVRSGMGPI